MHICIYWTVVGLLILIERFTLSERLKPNEAVRRGIGILTVMLPAVWLLYHQVSATWMWLATFTGFLEAGAICLFIDALQPVEQTRIRNARDAIAKASYRLDLEFERGEVDGSDC